MKGSLLNIFDTLTNTHQSIELPTMPGCVVPRRDGNLLLALQNGVHSYDPLTKNLQLIYHPEQDKPGNRFNDGKVDPK
jgi:sugar lactone lactonase YvrE